MKLTRKLALAWTLALTLVFSGDAWLQVRRDTQLFTEDLANDQRMLSESFANVIEEVFAMHGPDGARMLVRHIDESEAPIFIEWLPLAGGSVATAAPTLTEADHDALDLGETISITSLDEEGQESHATLRAIFHEGEPAALLRVSEPLTPQIDYIQQGELQILGALLLSLLALVGLAGGLGWVMVGRPAERLTLAARRIGSGNLDMPVEVGSNDELGRLGRELETMRRQLAESRSRLEEETEARLEAIRQVRHADRLRTVGQLSSGIAHELGTPLGVIAGRASMIENDRVPAEKLHRTAAIIHQQADRMTAVVRQLLDFARRGTAERAPADLADLVRRSVDLLQPLARPGGISLKTRLPDEPVLVHLDTPQMEQALTNLVQNAVQASKPGDVVEIGISHESRPDSEELAARLWVRDHGHGIAHADLQHLFDPFFTTKDVGEGTGLGLSVAHGIVSEHGGEIQVESEPGVGSRFSIVLPMQAPADGIAMPQQSAAARPEEIHHA